jgi:hypothetical protein
VEGDEAEDRGQECSFKLGQEGQSKVWSQTESQNQDLLAPSERRAGGSRAGLEVAAEPAGTGLAHSAEALNFLIHFLEPFFWFRSFFYSIS